MRYMGAQIYKKCSKTEHHTTSQSVAGYKKQILRTDGDLNPSRRTYFVRARRMLRDFALLLRTP